MLIFKKIDKNQIIIYSLVVFLMLLGTAFFIYKNYSLKKTTEKTQIDIIDSKLNIENIDLDGFKKSKEALDSDKFINLKDVDRVESKAEAGREDPFSSF